MADDIVAMLQPLRAELDRLQEDALFTGEYDTGDALMSLHAATGGIDAQDFTEMLLRMYLRWAERSAGSRRRCSRRRPGEEAGLKSATVTLRAARTRTGSSRPSAASTGSSASRRSTRRTGGTRRSRRSIVAPLLPDDAELELDEGDLRIDTYRASGAGGQHVNKTDSAVRITHLPTGIVVQCQNERSQTANKQTAMRMLRSRLAELAARGARGRDRARARRGRGHRLRRPNIRSYVLQPYQQVKDHRTGHEVGNAQGVLDGDLDGFIHAYLLAQASGEVV